MEAQLTLSGASGICIHLFLFRIGEWDLKAPLIVMVYALAFVLAISLDRFNTLPGISPIKLLGCHVLGIYSSIIFYRAFWHRLSGFPGPFWAKLSNLYVTALSAKKLHLYEEVQKMHQQYGDYVRLGMSTSPPGTHFEKAAAKYCGRILGPTELSIADPQAVQALYSGQAKVSKGPWYTILEPRVSLQMEREKKAHARRRKVWDQGFSSKGEREQTPVSNGKGPI
jgi:hypothetical protein